MKKSEELNLSEQTQFIRNYAKRHSDVESFYHSIDSLNIISVQDLSFKNDIELFREITFILSVIYSIISKPHLNNRREEIIARSGEASMMSQEDFLKTLSDSSLWKDQGGYNLIPEYVYYHQYEDDLRIYENIFIVHVINELSYLIDHYMALYVSLLKVADKSNSNLVLNNSAQESALQLANKLSRRLNQIKESYFYRDVSKAKNKPKVFYPTNILVKDRLYNLVYKFYRKMYIYEDKKDIDDELYLFYFALLFKVFRSQGFELDSRSNSQIYNEKEIIFPDRLIFTTSELRITVNLNKEEHSFLFNYKDRLDDASSNHLLMLTNDATFQDIKVKEKDKDIFSIEYLSLWHLGEIDLSNHVRLVNQTLMSEQELIYKFLNNHHYVVNGSEALYSSYCPSCKSKNITFDNGFYFCPDCGAIYKFAKSRTAKVTNKIVFAEFKGQ